MDDSKRFQCGFFQVAVDEKFSEPLALIDLFGFKGEKTASSATYMGNANIRIKINSMAYFSFRTLRKGIE